MFTTFNIFHSLKVPLRLFFHPRPDSFLLDDLDDVLDYLNDFCIMFYIIWVFLSTYFWKGAILLYFKVFFNVFMLCWQACRGDKLDGGVHLVKRTQVDSDTCQSYKIPAMADFLVAYSTAEGTFLHFIFTVKCSPCEICGVTDICITTLFDFYAFNYRFNVVVSVNFGLFYTPSLKNCENKVKMSLLN